MAKKAILNDKYNPVGERLRRVLDDVSSIEELEPRAEIPLNADELKPQVLDTESSVPSGARLDAELRCRCTKEERRKWNNYALQVTGEPNQFSNLLRSMLLLFEHAHEDIKDQGRIQELDVPSKKDPIAVARYEQQLAKLIWEALRRSSRPDFDSTT